MAQVADEKAALKFRDPTPEELEAQIKKHPKTGDNTHRATARGYAIVNNQGVLVEEGEMVPSGTPVSEEWMVKVKASDRSLAGALDEALERPQKDADLTQVGLPGLKAMAAERGINPKGLSEEDLITAIKAHAEAGR